MNPDDADALLPLTAAVRDAFNGAALDALKVAEHRDRQQAIQYALAAQQSIFVDALARLESALLRVAIQTNSEVGVSYSRPVELNILRANFPELSPGEG